jgi:hypothetical protein
MKRKDENDGAVNTFFDFFRERKKERELSVSTVKAESRYKMLNT